MVRAKVSPRTRPRGSRPTYEKGNDHERSEHADSRPRKGRSMTRTASETPPVKTARHQDEAEAAKPADAHEELKALEVSKGGTVVGWVLCRGYDHGLSICATGRILGQHRRQGGTRHQGGGGGEGIGDERRRVQSAARSQKSGGEEVVGTRLGPAGVDAPPAPGNPFS